MTIFSERLREARNAKGLSQAALAKLVKVQENTVWRWERERATPDIVTLERIALALGVTPTYLIGHDDKFASTAVDPSLSVSDEPADEKREASLQMLYYTGPNGVTLKVPATPDWGSYLKDIVLFVSANQSPSASAQPPAAKTGE